MSMTRVVDFLVRMLYSRFLQMHLIDQTIVLWNTSLYKISNIKISEIYESKAVLKENSPKHWNKNFLNIAISGDSNLSPLEILQEIKIIETSLGRPEKHEVWSPRVIDIDILAIDDMCLNSEELTIPHKLLYQRDFVLKPLSDIEPDWQYPVKTSRFYKLSVIEMLRLLFNIK